MTATSSLLESIRLEVVHGEAVSSMAASTPAPTGLHLLAKSPNYGSVAWWKENYDGFGFSDEHYRVFEAVTWGCLQKKSDDTTKGRT
jgi:hypothetical protein